MNPSDYKVHNISILWGACAIEAFLAILYLLLIPTDSKNVFFAGYSPIRIFLIICIVLGGMFFILLLYLTVKRPDSSGFFNSLSRFKIAEGWIFYSSILVLSVGLFLVVLTPPSLRGARIERLAPVLVWLCLCALQIAIFLVIDKREKIHQTSGEIQSFFVNRRNLDRIGYGLLVFSFIIGLLTIYFTYYNYGDEGDTYSVGWLLSNGNVLYKDVFSHHFPFSYMWVSLITDVFGTSILIIRLSLLLLRIGLFAVAMHLSRNIFVIGLTSFAWSLIGPMYLGNLLLYYSFSGIFIVCSIFVVIAILNKEARFSITHAIYVGVLVGLLALNDPVMLLPGGIILLFIVFSGFYAGEGRKQKIIYTLTPILAMGTVYLIYIVYPLSTASMNDFLQDAILFNTQVYKKYTGMTFSISGLFKDIISGFNLLDSKYRIYYSPYFHWEYFESLESWAFTALFFRLSIVFTSLIMVLNKRFWSGFLFYLTGVSLFFRDTSFFHGSPFIFLAIAGASITFYYFLDSITSIHIKERPANYLRLATKWIILVLAAIISISFIVLNVRMGEYYIQNRHDLSYENQFGHIINDSGYLRQFACNYENASLLVYPLNPGMYFFSKLHPSSAYLFMTPWVAEVAEQKVITDLKEKAAVVFIDKDTDIWGFKVKDYLADLIAFLDDEYIEVDKNVYISPILDKYCREQH